MALYEICMYDSLYETSVNTMGCRLHPKYNVVFHLLTKDACCIDVMLMTGCFISTKMLPKWKAVPLCLLSSFSNQCCLLTNSYVNQEKLKTLG